MTPASRRYCYEPLREVVRPDPVDEPTIELVLSPEELERMSRAYERAVGRQARPSPPAPQPSPPPVAAVTPIARSVWPIQDSPPQPVPKVQERPQPSTSSNARANAPKVEIWKPGALEAELSNRKFETPQKMARTNGRTDLVRAARKFPAVVRSFGLPRVSFSALRMVRLPGPRGAMMWSAVGAAVLASVLGVKSKPTEPPPPEQRVEETELITPPAPVAPAVEEAAPRSEPQSPVQFANPFDRSEIFEFPPGTSHAEARDAVAEVLLDRARGRLSRQDRLASIRGSEPNNR